MIRTSDKWTAFLLSALVPGAGQLAARSWTCGAWFLSVALLAMAGNAGEKWIDASNQWLLTTSGVLCGIALCLASAEHAKRLLECRREHGTAVRGSTITAQPQRGRQIDVGIAIELAQSQGELWKLVGDLPRFLTLDPFHDQVTLMRDKPAVGVDLVLSHNALGCRFLRFGKIVSWRPGYGYTFSDLSPRGSRVGFPHVFMIELEPAEEMSSAAPCSRLTIRIRGRWTSRVMPVWLGRWWVWMICREHSRLLCKAL